MIERDRKLVDEMAASGAPMPLSYMESNMHWYASEAVRYAALAAEAPRPDRFRTKKNKEAAEKKIAHYEVMTIKMRALNQAAAESAANYTHARIQSVSIGNSRGAKSSVLILRGHDADL